MPTLFLSIEALLERVDLGTTLENVLKRHSRTKAVNLEYLSFILDSVRRRIALRLPRTPIDSNERFLITDSNGTGIHSRYTCLSYTELFIFMRKKGLDL